MVRPSVFLTTPRYDELVLALQYKLPSPYNSSNSKIAELAIKTAIDSNINWIEVNTELNRVMLTRKKKDPKKFIIRFYSEEDYENFNVLKNDVIPKSLEINRITVPYCWQLLFMNLILSLKSNNVIIPDKKEENNDIYYIKAVNDMFTVLLSGNEEEKNKVKEIINIYKEEI